MQIDEEGNFLEQFIDQVTENEDKASKDALECMDSGKKRNIFETLVLS